MVAGRGQLILALTSLGVSNSRFPGKQGIRFLTPYIVKEGRECLVLLKWLCEDEIAILKPCGRIGIADTERL